LSRPSRGRRESNVWLRKQCEDIQGKVLSIGSENDTDREGDCYRNYFVNASSYETSEVEGGINCDHTLDVRAMPELEGASYDCVFCSGVLEHVDDYNAGLSEITRILKPGGILLLGLPFRQATHMAPNDFWRFTEYGIRHLLKNSYDLMALTAIDEKSGKQFPAAYWAKARKRTDRQAKTAHSVERQ
jgi:SAM-dependent methyltransferase